MYWFILNGLSFSSCTFIAVGAARNAKAGLVGYALAVAIGIALGGGAAWAMWSIGRKVAPTIETFPKAKQKLYFDVLFFAAVFWIAIAAYVSDQVTSAVMQLMA